MGNFRKLRELAATEKKLVESRLMCQMLNLLPASVLADMDLPADLLDFISDVSADDESDLKGVAFLGFLLSQRYINASKKTSGRISKLLTVVASALANQSPLTSKMLQKAEIAKYDEGAWSKLASQFGFGSEASKKKLSNDAIQEELRRIDQYLDDAVSLETDAQDTSTSPAASPTVTSDY